MTMKNPHSRPGVVLLQEVLMPCGALPSRKQPKLGVADAHTAHLRKRRKREARHIPEKSLSVLSKVFGEAERTKAGLCK